MATEKNGYPGIGYLKILAAHAGGIMKNHFGRAEYRLKHDGTPRVPAEEKIHEMVIRSLEKDFPAVAVHGEEGGREVKGARYKVVFDPLDGTLVFLMGKYGFTICISVIDNITGEPLAALIYDPVAAKGWTFNGERAYLNNHPVRVSRKSEIKGSKIAIFWIPECNFHLERVEWKLKDLGATCFNDLLVGRNGGAVAEGAVDASIFAWQHIWETSAMHPIVQGAGGKATDLFGNTLVYGAANNVRGHIISNGLIHDELVRVVQTCQQ